MNTDPVKGPLIIELETTGGPFPRQSPNKQGTSAGNRKRRSPAQRFRRKRGITTGMPGGPSTLRSHINLSLVLILLSVAILATGSRAESGGADSSGNSSFAREEPFVVRPFINERTERWLGKAVCYGPHRDGQGPGGPSPTREQIREDLGIIVRHWRMIRLYGTTPPAKTILDVIREEGLDLEVMLGIWIAPEEKQDKQGDLFEKDTAAAEANRKGVETGIRFAAEFPNIVTSICVGNETQVSWSPHPSPLEILIRYIREVRAGTGLPVTTADDYNYWNKPESRAVAREIDFINCYAHPLWNGVLLDDALDWTRKIFREIQAAHPDREVVLGETGWATSKHDEGEQARLIKGRAGEEEQKVYYRAVTDWAEREKVPVFFFEAFDENWKGGDHPDEVEKHWGVYRADRNPKEAIADES